MPYRRVGKANAYLFIEDPHGNLNFSQTGTSYEFDQIQPVPPPPPPPSSFTFLPVPAGWTPVLQADFTARDLMSLSTLNDWAYGGRPGGTTGCTWDAKQLTFVAGEGALITTEFQNGGWISAGFGTNAKYPFPIRVRFYEIARDANIDGKNRVRLLWAGNWIEEVDCDECSVSNGHWQPSWVRVHNGSGANVISPIAGLAPVVGTVRCTEVELALVNGTPTCTLRVDGNVTGTSVIPASDWATMLANPHWIGCQDQMYSIGTAPQAAVSVSQILGCEVFHQ